MSDFRFDTRTASIIISTLTEAGTLSGERQDRVENKTGADLCILYMGENEAL